MTAENPASVHRHYTSAAAPFPEQMSLAQSDVYLAIRLAVPTLMALIDAEPADGVDMTAVAAQAVENCGGWPMALIALNRLAGTAGLPPIWNDIEEIAEPGAAPG